MIRKSVQRFFEKIMRNQSVPDRIGKCKLNASPGSGTIGFSRP
jgi:hypothetical protein